MRISPQGDLFAEAETRLPEGLRYQPAVVPEAVQSDLLREIRQLPLKPFDFHGFEGKRKVISYGWKYDFDRERVRRIDDVPPFLLPVRTLAADFAGVEPDGLQQALITEYAPGAPIGWHKDKKVFGRVIGVSLLSPCTFRLRRRAGPNWERVSVIAEPGSVYLLSGPARSEWEHSIPPVEQLRYSITFREIG
ncbi:alpha-ketoglutarate-dependent dioxygenase AlkB [Rhizobium sp. SEMIA 4085]|uniref:Oxoglutarate/iron-dependent oxygenase protein n=1 Tax=Rhizobium gallicum bv. gallicum R602sp TaxID=1041138 RepID=A0A0B4X9H7_9HYPH|nr:MULTISPECIES: alpha-ketoglutarate-dependent dioxygenase AlkB [Rhizobium]AJD44654.1 oxoglutarate/iron-dependent oxygenase protein [Rhizobium gallicum bv. gallicum R602sp]NNH32131.1 alpha-ketoglutarate-dependent dioxygenase AlkB [Rhizobium sp. SEMIA 4085]TDW33310.1 alkylated DNA repair dioxygenase AlkB [Rhizobium azibense]